MSHTRTVDYENLYKLNLPFRQRYLEDFAGTLDSGWFILGKKVEKFEKEFAEFLGVPYVLGLASGLDALELPLLAFDFPEGSEVIVPSNTYIATINAVINTGHKPVLVEPDPSTFNIDPLNIEAKITPNTRAIIVVHLFGKTCDMDPILELCKKYDLKLIEDCAQSHGSMYKGKVSGTFGDAGAFSFYPTKNLGALGDGGAIACKDENLYMELKALRNYGSYVKYKNEYIGYNSRLDEVQAGFLSIKLESLCEINAHKVKLAHIYLNGLDKDKFKLPRVEKDYFDVYHIFGIQSQRRDALRNYLLEHGIKTEIHYPIAPCMQRSIREYFSKKNWKLDEADSRIALRLHEQELSLPCSFMHSEEDIQYVVSVMNAF